MKPGKKEEVVNILQETRPEELKEMIFSVENEPRSLWLTRPVSSVMISSYQGLSSQFAGNV